MIDMRSRRSLPNCKIDYEVAEGMYQATTILLPVDGNPDRAQIIGGYLGWALDEIDRLRERIAELKEALVEERARRICHLPREDKVGHWPRYEDLVVEEARKQLRAEGAIR